MGQHSSSNDEQADVRISVHSALIPKSLVIKQPKKRAWHCLVTQF